MAHLVTCVCQRLYQGLHGTGRVQLPKGPGSLRTHFFILNWVLQGGQEQIDHAHIFQLVQADAPNGVSSLCSNLRAIGPVRERLDERLESSPVVEHDQATNGSQARLDAPTLVADSGYQLIKAEIQCA